MLMPPQGGGGPPANLAGDGSAGDCAMLKKNAPTTAAMTKIRFITGGLLLKWRQRRRHLGQAGPPWYLPSTICGIVESRRPMSCPKRALQRLEGLMETVDYVGEQGWRSS